jgi:mono/diheme cytochrome c family protein
MKQKQRLARRVPNMIILGISIACMAIIAMAPLPAANAESPERWYEQSQVESGQSVYEKNCSSCHGTRGEATVNWRRPDSDGKFPPPPLNGTAHTWHHPFRVLAQQIKFGAPAGAGTMPAFKDILNDEKIINVIAWIQSLWSDEIYAQWWNIQVRSSR